MFRNEQVIKIWADVAAVDSPPSWSGETSRASTATQTTTHTMNASATNTVPPIPPHVIHSIFHSVNAVADSLKQAETETAAVADAEAPSMPPSAARNQKEAAFVHNIFGPLTHTLMQVDKVVRVAADRAGAAAEATSSKESATKAPSETTKEAPKDAPAETKPTSEPKSPPPEAPKAEETDQTEESSPPNDEVNLFIHGRHTCDGCLTTPIVGKRFHAVNLPDYDLCENCMKNYTGDQVKFEEAELGTCQ